MTRENNISKAVISRLPLYYRALCRLAVDGKTRVSSSELASMLGGTASQVRQDLNCFGGFGQQGMGYDIDRLKSEIRDILGLDKIKTAVIIGAGNLGRAIANKLTNDELNFIPIGIFDSDPVFSSLSVKGLPIMQDDELPAFCEKFKPDIAVLCIPDDKAPELTDNLVMLGIRNFWNFTGFDIKKAYPFTNSENVYLTDSLITLSYLIKNS